jgi:hypothetical protein
MWCNKGSQGFPGPDTTASSSMMQTEPPRRRCKESLQYEMRVAATNVVATDTMAAELPPIEVVVETAQ